MVWTSAHTILGEFENGRKLVQTVVTPDSGAATGVRISPLKEVYTYFPGVRHPGTVPTTFSFALTVGNLITVTSLAGADASGGSLAILSIGV
jgi:hypothetical protein